jgi:hypothetical protein
VHSKLQIRASWLATEPDLFPTDCALMASPELNHTIAM